MAQYTITLPAEVPTTDLAHMARLALSTQPGSVDPETAALLDHEAIGIWTVTKFWIPQVRDYIARAKQLEAQALADTATAPFVGVTITPA